MFSSLGLFKDTPCPYHPQCSHNQCFFAHDPPSTSRENPSALGKSTGAHHIHPEEINVGDDGPRKRRRIGGKLGDQPGLSDDQASPGLVTPEPDVVSIELSTSENALPRTASRKISPPPRRIVRDASTKTSQLHSERHAHGQATQNENGVSRLQPSTKKIPTARSITAEESLNPRMLPNPPVSHAIRMKLTTMLHEQMVRLNDEIVKSQDASKRALGLSHQALIVETLDEEFQAAKKNPLVYQNVVKARIMVLRKMKLDVWKEERIKKLAEKQINLPQQKPCVPKSIETGLTAAEEISFLPRLAANQKGLSQHGYVTTMPTPAELEVARKGVESAQGWELCDRCKTRFQVFPGRRADDGALTSGGSCTYHWAKPRRPDAVKGDNKPRDLKYSCCDEAVGVSAGCTKADTHVFKASDPKRLALVMPFEQTPPSDRMNLPGAVCFDCEMGYTTCGLELIRLTATSWPDGGELLDVLVRPIGEVLDLNSRFSGVRAKDWTDAAPYNESKEQPDNDNPPVLQIVESPAMARDLLFSLLTPATPLTGHALENDLNAVRIIHPVIVDTCLIYSHPRGLPIRYGLKVLMKKHLDGDIQMGGDQGHDSKEDARAAGDLVRLRVGKMWAQMQLEGWSIEDGGLCSPAPLGVTNAKS